LDDSGVEHSGSGRAVHDNDTRDEPKGKAELSDHLIAAI
jgi:hypothetical protein